MTKKQQMAEQQILNLAKRSAQIARDKLALDIKILDLRELTSMTDFFIICSGEVKDHVKQLKKD